MMSTDDLIKKYYSLKPYQYGFLEAFKLHRNISANGCSDYSLELLMCSTSPHHLNSRLHLTFSGVKDLKIGDLGGFLSFLIEIRPIQKYQLEGVKYKVVESEYNSFSFLCSDIEAIVK